MNPSSTPSNAAIPLRADAHRDPADSSRSDVHPRPVRRVVIAGGGTAGWMTAACIARTMGRTLDITLVESEEIGTVGVGEATIPTMLTFHNLLGINEQEFMQATQATFKLGIRFEHWRDVDRHYIHSFGTTGQDHWTAGFQHFWLEGQARGLAGPYSDYCLELQAGEASRFAHLPRQGLNYAYHLDATRYAAFLRRMSEALGVRRVEGRIARVNQTEGGDIAALVMADGAMVEGDLFIDCSGLRSVLLGQTLNVGYEDWSHWLPCDSAVAVQTESVGPAVPYTRSIAHPFGWQWRIPLQHRVGNGLVYSSAQVDDDTARQTLLQGILGQTTTDPRVIRFKPGRRDVAWHRNCVAIGLSSGFLEPLESTSIHLIQRGVIRLMQMFPSEGILHDTIAEYNRQTQLEWEHIRDFIILHYHVTERDDSPMWRHCRTMDVPASLSRRIELFKANAQVYRTADELFAENSWIQVLLGQGVTPSQHHPIAAMMPDAELAGFLDEIRRRVQGTVQQLPAHDDYVRQYCRVMQGTAQRAGMKAA